MAGWTERYSQSCWLYLGFHSVLEPCNVFLYLDHNPRKWWIKYKKKSVPDRNLLTKKVSTTQFSLNRKECVLMELAFYLTEKVRLPHLFKDIQCLLDINLKDLNRLYQLVKWTSSCYYSSPTLSQLMLKSLVCRHFNQIHISLRRMPNKAKRNGKYTLGL